MYHYLKKCLKRRPQTGNPYFRGDVMSRIILNKEDLTMAYRIAEYYRNPYIVSEDEKIVFSEAKKKNRDIQYVALEINRRHWRGRE